MFFMQQAGESNPDDLLLTGEALQGSYHVAFAQSQEPENLRSAVLGLVRNARGPMALKSLGAEGQEVASLGEMWGLFQFLGGWGEKGGSTLECNKYLKTFL